MRTLPTLPGCGQPATIRIEIYSAANGTLHGSLDAAVYVCDQHGIEAVSAIQAAGLTAYRCTAPMPLGRPCGHVHTYPTAEQAAVAEHPGWCNRDRCEQRREHRSAVAPVNTNHPEAAVIAVALLQALHPAAEPMLSLTSAEGPVTEHVIMSIGQGRALSYVLRRLIDAAKGGR